MGRLAFLCSFALENKLKVGSNQQTFTSTTTEGHQGCTSRDQPSPGTQTQPFPPLHHQGEFYTCGALQEAVREHHPRVPLTLEWLVQDSPGAVLEASASDISLECSGDPSPCVLSPQQVRGSTSRTRGPFSTPRPEPEVTGQTETPTSAGNDVTRPPTQRSELPRWLQVQGGLLCLRLCHC